MEIQFVASRHSYKLHLGCLTLKQNKLYQDSKGALSLAGYIIQGIFSASCIWQKVNESLKVSRTCKQPKMWRTNKQRNRLLYPTCTCAHGVIRSEFNGGGGGGGEGGLAPAPRTPGSYANGLPTGFGKSLCYEVCILPFVFDDKLGKKSSVVIVVLSLVSLMFGVSGVVCESGNKRAAMANAVRRPGAKKSNS